MSKSQNKNTTKAAPVTVEKPIGLLEKYHLPFLLIFTFLVFANTLGHDFVTWDDHVNIYENDLVTTFSFETFIPNTIEIFKANIMGNYNPLSIFSFAIDKLIFGIENPWGFHLINVLLHIVCVFFVYKLAIALKLDWKIALTTALLFAIHPMRSESVAWATERKDVLFGSFYLWALWLYTKNVANNTNKNTILIAFLFLLSLLAKIQAVILPVSMVAVDYYFSGKIQIKDFINKWYLFIMSLTIGIIGLIYLREAGSLTIDSKDEFPFFVRIFIGSYSLLVYLIKSVIPYEMSALYPYIMPVPWYIFASIIIVPVFLTLLYFTYKNDKRLLFFGLIFFFVNVALMLQVLGAGQGFLADRFTYIPYLGLFIIYAWFINKFWNFHMAGNAAIIGLFSIYTFTTIRQNMVWKNSETLWSNVIELKKDTENAYFNRANYRRDQKDIQGAILDYNMVLKLKPDAMTYNSKAKLYNDNFSDKDSLAVALDMSNKAIALGKEAGYLANRGIIRFKLGMIDQALADLNEAITLDKNDPAAYYNKFVVYNKLGRPNEALPDLEKNLELEGKDPNLWFEASRLNYANGDMEKALKYVNKAIELKESTPNFYYQRGLIYYFKQDMNNAKADISKSISLGYPSPDPTVLSQLNIQF